MNLKITVTFEKIFFFFLVKEIEIKIKMNECIVKYPLNNQIRDYMSGVDNDDLPEEKNKEMIKNCSYEKKKAHMDRSTIMMVNCHLKKK